MIQATDLRIGNWVNANGLYEGKLMQVEQIGTKATLSEGVRVILFKDNHAGEFLKDCEPILLTPEILVKCGFDRMYRLDNGKTNPCYAKASFAVMFRQEGYFIDWIGGNTQIEYLHELQNVHFALLKEELEFKP